MLSNYTLLYVEDDKASHTELLSFLTTFCKHVYSARNGEEGLRLFREHYPDIVLSDIRMPVMDGIAMAGEILREKPDTPIIITSAFNESEFLLKAIRTGIKNYLFKPIDLQELMDALRKVSEELDLKRSLHQAQELLTQYKKVVDESSIVSKTDRHGIITYANQPFVTISGYSLEELLGKSHNIIRHPDMPRSFFKELWKTVRSKKTWNGIVRNLAKDGTTYVVDSTIIPILDLNGDITEYISIRKDITHQEQQRQDLEKSLHSSSKTLEEKVKFILEYEKALKSSTLFLRTTLDGTIQTVSEAFAKRLEYDEPELIGERYMRLLEAPYQNLVKDAVRNDVLFQNPWQGIVYHRSKTGKQLALETSFVPIMNAQNSVQEVFCFYVDLTEQTRLNDAIIETQREVIVRMGAIGETRSQETGDHVKRVADYSRLLALKAGMTEHEAEELKMASPMHDIGKVGIEDSILHKHGKLTDEEYETMKTHTMLGYEMLKHSNQKLLKTAAIVAHQHHERWDGAGYPRGLSGEEIHLIGRITAVADVFDALAHDRAYKQAWPMEKIVAYFESERGKQFDPVLTDLFLDNLDEFLAIKTRYHPANRLMADQAEEVL